VFEAVVFAAGLSEVGDAGGAAVGPSQEVVGLVVEGRVVAAREGALASRSMSQCRRAFGTR
jgi:hypothetical protein